jgi:hypothetical protein
MNAWEEPGLFFGCLGLYETWDVLNAVRQQRQAQKTPADGRRPGFFLKARGLI